MPDLQPWWKLWCNALDDPALEALSLEDWARWARLALLVKRHGDGGRLGVPPPYRPLLEALKYRDEPGHQSRIRGRLVAAIQKFPNVRVEVGHGDAHVITVTYLNWQKYQEAPSKDRTRRWREKQRHSDSRDSHQQRHSDGHSDGHRGPDVTVQEEKRRDTPLSPTSPRRSPTGLWGLPPEAFNTDCPRHQRPYPAAKPVPVWTGCLNTTWLSQHPDAKYPTSDAQGTPKQCPAHRVQPSAEPVKEAW